VSQSHAGAALNLDRASLEDLCRRHHIRSLKLFGSALRDDFGPQSDVDLLVEFESGWVPGFLRLHTIADELSDLAQHRPIDLVTIGALNPRLRDRVLRDAEVLFAA
jgi:predicted nucleotidyltransferase